METLPMLPDRARDAIDRAVDDWIAEAKARKTRDTYVESLNRIYLFLQDADPRIGAADARRILEAWEAGSPPLRAPLAPSAIRLTLSVGRRLWDRFQAKGYVQENPWRLVQIPAPADKRAERILEPSEVQALFRAAGRHELLLWMLYYTGCRADELTRIRWRDFHPHDGGTVSVLLHGKGSKDREVPVPGFLWDAIRASHPVRSPDAWMWPGRVQDRPRKTPRRPNEGPPHLTTRAVWKSVRAVVETAQRHGWIPKHRNPSPHWFRHAYATHLLMKDRRLLLSIQTRLGHARPETTERYLHLGPAAMAQFDDEVELDLPDRLKETP